MKKGGKKTAATVKRGTIILTEEELEAEMVKELEKHGKGKGPLTTSEVWAACYKAIGCTDAALSPQMFWRTHVSEVRDTCRPLPFGLSREDLVGGSETVFECHIPTRIVCMDWRIRPHMESLLRQMAYSPFPEHAIIPGSDLSVTFFRESISRLCLSCNRSAVEVWSTLEKETKTDPNTARKKRESAAHGMGQLVLHVALRECKALSNIDAKQLWKTFPDESLKLARLMQETDKCKGKFTHQVPTRFYFFDVRPSVVCADCSGGSIPDEPIIVPNIDSGAPAIAVENGVLNKYANDLNAKMQLASIAFANISVYREATEHKLETSAVVYMHKDDETNGWKLIPSPPYVNLVADMLEAVAPSTIARYCRQMQTFCWGCSKVLPKHPADLSSIMMCRGCCRAQFCGTKCWDLHHPIHMNSCAYLEKLEEKKDGFYLNEFVVIPVKKTDK